MIHALLVAAQIAVAANAAASTASATPSRADPSVRRATPTVAEATRTPTAVVIDGRDDDSVWRTAQIIDSYQQRKNSWHRHPPRDCTVVFLLSLCCFSVVSLNLQPFRSWSVLTQ